MSLTTNQDEKNPLASFYSFKSSTYNAQLEASPQNQTLVAPPQEQQSVFHVPDLPSSFSAFDLVFWAFTDFLPTLTNFSSELQFNSLTHTFFVKETELASYLSHHVHSLSLFPSSSSSSTHQTQSSFFEHFFEPLFFQSESLSLQHKAKIEFFYFLIHSLFLPAFSRILHLVQAEVLKNTRNEMKKKEVVEEENEKLVHEIFNKANFSFKPELFYLACEDCLTYTRTFLEKAFPQLLTEEMQLPQLQITSEKTTPHFFKHIDEIKTFFSQRAFLLESQQLSSIKPPIIASPSSSLISINAPPQVKSKLAAFFASTQKSPHKNSPPPARPFDLSSTIQSIQSSSSFFKRRQFLRFIKQCALQNYERDFQSYYEETRETLRPFFEKQFLDFNVTNIITFILNSVQKYYRNMTRFSRGGDESGKYGLSTEFLFGSQSLDFVDPYFLIFHSRQHGTGKSTLARKIFIESFEQSLFLNSIRIPMKHDPSVLKPRDLSATIKLADAGSSLFQFFDDLGPHNIDVTHLKALTSDTDYSYQLKNSNDILTVPFCFNPIFTANLGFDEVKKLIKDPTGDRRLLGVIFPEKTPSFETLSLFEDYSKSGAFTRILTGVNPRWNSKNSMSSAVPFEELPFAESQKQFFSHYHKIKNSSAYKKVRSEYKRANNFDDVEREFVQSNLLYPTLALYKISSISSSFRNPPLFFILSEEDLNERVLKPLKNLIFKDSILFLPTKFLFPEKFLEKTSTQKLRAKAQVVSFNTSLEFVQKQPNFQLLHSPDLSPPLLDHLKAFYASHPSPVSTPVSFLAVTPSTLANLK